MRIVHSITFCFSIFLFFIFLNCYSQSLIYLPLRYDVPAQEIYQLLVKPQKNAYLVLKKIGSAHPLMGILATYAGYITTSNEFGEIIFPRHQERTPLYIAITEEIAPVMRFFGTIDHWEFSSIKDTLFIEIDLQRSTTSPDASGEQFSVKTVSIPEDNIVPYATIVIFGDPDDFEIPEGLFPHNHKKHWILPPLVLKKSTGATKNMVTTLPLLQFFRPLSIIAQKPNPQSLIRMNK